ncbi:Retrotransposon nucleocapsid protein, partial [Globisporangium splendens]
MTTSHRAQADGQTERQNLILEDALRCMTSYHGSDWSEKLATTEYAHATLTSASTGLSPFEIDTGRKERHPVGLPAASNISKRKETTDLAEIAKTFHDEREKIIDKAKKQLKQAQESQKRYYDQKRSNVTFKTGDLVMLDTRRMSLQHAAQDIEVKRAKLAARKIGPFPIEKMIDDNVAKLKLPSRMKRMIPSFNVDILSHYVPNHDRFKTRLLPKASRVYIDEDTGDEMYIVEKLLRQRRVNRKTQWLIKWHGYPENEATWENEDNVKNVSHWNVLIGEYQQLQREVNRGRM